MLYDVYYANEKIGQVMGRDYQECLKKAEGLAQERCVLGRPDFNKLKIVEPKKIGATASYW